MEQHSILQRESKKGRRLHTSSNELHEHPNREERESIYSAIASCLAK